MIWLLLIFKTIVLYFLIKKQFYYSGSFLSCHILCDCINKLTSSYWFGNISFIIIPHILIALIAKSYDSKIIRNINIISCLFLIINLFITPFEITTMLVYFFFYALFTLIVLNKKIISFDNQEFLPLIGALIFQMLEIEIYITYPNYLIINTLNIIYYLCLFVYLLKVYFQPLNSFFCEKIEKEIRYKKVA